MRENIKKLRLCGNMFNMATDLPLFGGNLSVNKKGFCSLVYGRNGAGKSTIAKAFRRLSTQEENGIVSSDLCDVNGTIINLNEDEKKKIYVFDQKFVEDNIKLVSDGLETIVMLGNQVELDKQIQAVEEKQRENYEQLSSIKESLDNLNDDNYKGSPLYYEKQMEEALKGDKNWAGRDRLIRGKEARKNTPVSKTSYKEFIKDKPNFTRDELLIKFNNSFKELEKVRNGDKKITQKLAVVELKVNDSNIRKLLLKRIEKPSITDRDKLLLDILQQRGVAFVKNIDETFHDSSVKSCPYCLQPISDSYKKDLLLSVENILNQEVKRYQEHLSSCIMEEVKRDFTPFLPLGDITEKCIDLLNKVNLGIESYNSALKKKIENPYKFLLVREYNLQQLISDLNYSIKELEFARRKYNDTVSDEEPLKTKLSSINAGIAYYDLYPIYVKYKKASIAYGLVEEKYKEILIKCDHYKTRLDDLNARKKNVHIAEDMINDSLSYIFYSKDRIKINYVNGCYKILVNGQLVLPSNISTGETNAIALCYFFSTIGAGKTLEDIYKDNYLIVIDDPITSFDNENKIGMLSYIKSQLIQFIRGNLDTKVLIMTHDMMTFMNIYHIYEEIASSIKSIYAASNGIQLKNHFWILRDGTLNEYKDREANEYSRLFRSVYNFIISPSDFDCMPIGNMMRQLLEAFSTFQYKLGIADLSTKENILSLIPNEYKKCIENFMYRLVLHNGSHREEEVKFSITMNFNSMYTLNEKIRTAKLLMTFLYLLNPEHVLAHLQSNGNSQGNGKIKMDLDRWKEEVKDNSI